MQELIQQLMDKAGLSQESATKAVDTTMGYIKGKLPPMFADKFEDLVSGKFDINSLLGGFFGGGADNAASDNSGDASNSFDQLKNMFGK